MSLVEALALLGILLAGAIAAEYQNFNLPANGDVRLTNGMNAFQGFLEIYHRGSWGTICFTESFNNNASQTVCQQLGYVGASSVVALEATSVDYFDTGSGTSSVPVWFTDVHCSQPELHILRCSVSSNISDYCASHTTDVYLYCDSTLLTAAQPYFGQVALNNTESPYKSQGLLMIYLNQKWGTVCNISFTSSAPADSVCQQLGYTNAAAYGISPVPGFGIIWLNDASKCEDPQPCFNSCYQAPTIRDISCNHVADLAVYCTFNTSLNKSRPSGSADACMIQVKEVPSGLVGFLIFVFCTIILVYVTGFVVRCIVAGYHNSAAYRERSMRSGEVERRRFITIQNSLTESEVQSPVSDSSTSDSELPVQL